MPFFTRIVTFFILFFAVLTTSVSAADWIVGKVRQPAQYTINGDDWVKLDVGMKLPSSSWIHTGKSGRLIVNRGKEFIQFKPNTLAAIAKRDSAGKKVLIRQQFGNILVDVETRNQKHLKVETPFLSAVVKGTRFSVSVEEGSANLAVDRGVVEVTDSRNGLQADVNSSQNVSVSSKQTNVLNVEGPGPKSKVKRVAKKQPKVATVKAEAKKRDLLYAGMSKAAKLEREAARRAGKLEKRQEKRANRKGKKGKNSQDDLDADLELDEVAEEDEAARGRSGRGDKSARGRGGREGKNSRGRGGREGRSSRGNKGSKSKGSKGSRSKGSKSKGSKGSRSKGSRSKGSKGSKGRGGRGKGK
ncbi:MAG: FecR domain-containing protein [Nitratireductor sp.]